MCSFLGGECNISFSTTPVPFWGQTMHNRRTSILCEFRSVFFSFKIWCVGALSDIHHLRLGSEGFASFDAEIFIRLDETIVLLLL